MSPPSPPAGDAKQAVADSRAGLEDADRQLAEMQVHTASIRFERQKNHFAPLLTELIMRRR